jgi:hypothetical protein
MSVLDEVIDDCHKLQKKIASKKIILEKALGRESTDIPIVAFNIIHNSLISTTEISEFYRPAIHSALKNKLDPQRFQRLQHNTSRIIEVQKLFFVNSLSAFEYYIKKYYEQNPKVLGKIKGRWIHLWDIMNRSKEIDLISESDFKLWEGINNVRRFIIHNNSYPDCDVEYKYPLLKLVLKQDEPAGRGIEMIPSMYDWIIDAGADWILKFHNQASKID